jgi:hypothetical protein
MVINKSVDAYVRLFKTTPSIAVGWRGLERALGAALASDPDLEGGVAMRAARVR